MTLRPYQKEAHDAVVTWIKKNRTPCLIEAATGCHAAGHPILMFDGSIKPVEMILVGDRVMGPDSKPRTVMALHRGRDDMFRVEPSKGESFVVNAGHIFSLYITPSKRSVECGYTEASTREILSFGPTARHVVKLQRCAVDFATADQIVPPWVVGVLIGDGCLTQLVPSFCSPDMEVVSGVQVWASSLGCKLSSQERNGCGQYNIVDSAASRSVENRCRAALKAIGIYGCSAAEKRVPANYMVADRDQRLEMIAGLLDTDGHLTRGGYDWISKSKGLAEDMVFLCRSVGLAAYVRECTKGYGGTFKAQYWRVSISGDCTVIPCRVERKKASPRLQKKRIDVVGFTMRAAGVGDYFGFELDGDHLYLDGYFVRHHNSGKSHIISAVASTVHDVSKGKHVLVLQPSAELVEQNAEKYRATGSKCSIFSASVGEKSLRWPVVFGTPLTVKNRISRFGSQFAAVVIDECHGITPTVLSIIEAMREANPNLRVVGLSATPYRMNTGYIFGMWPDGKPVSESETKEPYFGACVYRIRARSLIDQGFLTAPIIGSIGVASYETLNMQVNSRGQFDAGDIDRAFHGHGRKTAEIIADVIGQSRGREGVMIFAATVRHAEECMASLPPGLSAIVTGETPKADRKRILKEFKARKIKYLVNVSVLTTGFDAPHVDVVAILRATESVGLLQQIVGRGLRLSPGKANCLVLDYAQNIDRHCPDGDIFTPEIKVRGGEKGEAKLTCECPDCGIENEFSARPNEEDYSIDRYGYFLDLDGLQIETEWGAMPAHFGRRCQGKTTVAGDLVQCGYRWTSKPCPSCDAPNDIAARYCTTCKAEIVDPNEKLRLDFKQLKKDPTKIQCDEVIDWRILPSISRSGKEVDRVDVVTPYRSFSYWVLKHPAFSRAMKERAMLDSLGGRAPMTITYQKDAETGFYRAIAYNRPKDEAPKGHPDLGKPRVPGRLPGGNAGAGDVLRPPAPKLPGNFWHLGDPSAQ